MRFNPTGDDSRPRIEDYLKATGNTLEADSYKSPNQVMVILTGVHSNTTLRSS